MLCVRPKTSAPPCFGYGDSEPGSKSRVRSSAEQTICLGVVIVEIRRWSANRIPPLVLGPSLLKGRLSEVLRKRNTWFEIPRCILKNGRLYPSLKTLADLARGFRKP